LVWFIRGFLLLVQAPSCASSQIVAVTIGAWLVVGRWHPH